MDESHQVNFRFGGVTEVRYLRAVPAVGERVLHEGKPWLVTLVDEDGVGPVVICERAKRDDEDRASFG
jgi:hypothetical protein